jgi:DNA-binding NtrC family response regulator
MNAAGAKQQPYEAAPFFPQSRVVVFSVDPLCQQVISETLKEAVEEIRFVNPDQDWNQLVTSPISYNVALVDATDIGQAYRLMETLRETWPCTEIILLSQSDDEQIWVESIQRGAYDLLPIPLNTVELRRIVKNAISRTLPA